MGWWVQSAGCNHLVRRGGTLRPGVALRALCASDAFDLLCCDARMGCLACLAAQPVAQHTMAHLAGFAVMPCLLSVRHIAAWLLLACRKQYIEEQLAQRMGKQQGGGEDEGEQRPAPTDLDALLPETLRPRAVDTELGPSWVAGITEVPLTVEQKLKNIEETEAAKKRILQKSMALMTQGAAGVVEGDAGPGGARRGAFPVRFGRLNPEEEARIAANRAKKAEQREFHYKKRMEHKERNARAPAWL